MTSDEEYLPEFGCYDSQADLSIRDRNRPHWFQPGAAIYLTLRTADSLPKAVVEGMVAELEQWLKLRGKPPELAVAALRYSPESVALIHSQLTYRESRELKAKASRLTHRSLDECHGRCILRDERYAKIVADAMHHHAGVKYELDRFVVMPNHVHALAQFRDGESFRSVGQSWLRYTARIINQLRGESGSLWAEPFDHIIRSPDYFRYVQRYIENNPKKIDLKPTEYLYWQRPEDPRESNC